MPLWITTSSPGAVPVGVGVFFRGPAVGRPAGVAQAVHARPSGLLGDDLLQVAQLARGASDGELARGRPPPRRPPSRSPGTRAAAVPRPGRRQGPWGRYIRRCRTSAHSSPAATGARSRWPRQCSAAIYGPCHAAESELECRGGRLTSFRLAWSSCGPALDPALDVALAAAADAPARRRARPRSPSIPPPT